MAYNRAGGPRKGRKKVCVFCVENQKYIYRKKTRTLSPCLFWHFPSFARGQYQRTAPARKIRNLSHFLEV